MASSPATGEGDEVPSCVPAETAVAASMQAELAMVNAVNGLETRLLDFFATEKPATTFVLHCLDAIRIKYAGKVPRTKQDNPSDEVITQLVESLGQAIKKTEVISKLATDLFLWIAHMLRFLTASLSGGTETRVSNIFAIFLWTHQLDIVRCLDVAEGMCFVESIIVRGRPRDTIRVIRNHLESRAETFANFDTQPLEDSI